MNLELEMLSSSLEQVVTADLIRVVKTLMVKTLVDECTDFKVGILHIRTSWGTLR